MKKRMCLISLTRQSKARSGVLPLAFLLSFLMPHQIQQYRLWLEPIRSQGTRRKQWKHESELLVRNQRSSLEIQWRIPAQAWQESLLQTSSNIELMLWNQLVVSPRMQMNGIDCCQLWQWTTLTDSCRNCLAALQTRWQQPKSIVFYLDVVEHHLSLNSLASVSVLRCWGNFPNFPRETMYQGHPRVGALLWMGKKLQSIIGKTVLKSL